MDGPDEYLFGRIVGIAIADRGVTYVADAVGSTVRAYDPNGRYLATIGSEGDGPGEFRHLLGLDIDPRGDLVVRGAFRLSVFRESTGSGVAASLIRAVPIQGPNPDRDIRGRAVGHDFYGPSYFWEGFQRRGYFYLVYDSVGTISDTVFVPPFREPESTGRANYPVNAQGGRNVDGINRSPFEPRPSWDVDEEGHILFAEGARYEIVKVGPGGDTLLTIRRPDETRPVPEGEGRDSAHAFLARLDSVPVPLSQVRGMSQMARAREIPDLLPEVIGVQVGEGGNLWVRRWPRGADESIFDVFDANGEALWQVVVPAMLTSNPAPWISGDQIAGVVVDPATRVETVAVFRLTR
ncbi:MAG: 6-bladed beta-propeller [Longimicrobiales bacterium]